ncbi:Sbal_3080 family lipoprotein [Desulfovibrio sp. Huiquan2017]|uniref:Sbal_3080 family lipoprotein n=1 Tax=Desulfovibrio sp. Huiquan2017 TaxID=2816861 RepID=UPI001A91D013|nr:Sbal_3080 family lipoprotein [Desulfovibrio sp. Huiquan2017]
MRKCGLLLFLFILLAMAGCGKFDVINDPAEGISQAKKICIIKNTETREGFIVAMEHWLDKEGIAYRVLPAGSHVGDAEWTLTYYGLWSWDLALFLSDAEINAFHNKEMVGRVKLRVGQWDAHKFEKGEKRIYNLMDMLFAKIDRYPSPSSNKKE